jgi:glycosyltransferase involved in cell wall biosynthesis
VCIGHRWVDTPAEVPDGVLILEDWPNRAVRAAWRRAIAGVVPSAWQEPFGIVALEAMDAGVPVVASATGGLAEVVDDGETGLLVPPGDAGALADAIGRLVADVELRRRLGDGAARRIERYRPDAIVPRIEASYRRALSGDRPRAA